MKARLKIVKKYLCLVGKSSCDTKKTNLNNPTWDILLLHLMIIAKEKTGKIHWNMTIRPGPTPLLLHNTTWRIYYTSYIACFPKIHSHAENTFSYTLCYQCCNFVCKHKVIIDNFGPRLLEGAGFIHVPNICYLKPWTA